MTIILLGPQSQVLTVHSCSIIAVIQVSVPIKTAFLSLSLYEILIICIMAEASVEVLPQNTKAYKTKQTKMYI